MPYNKHFSTRETPQNQPIPGTDQVANSEGGYVFAVDDWTRLQRFLILGSEGGTYYIGERELTVENAEAALRLINSDGEKVVEQVVVVSTQGRAPKNDPALFVLAMAASLGDKHAKKAAFDALPKVARIGTHLFMFVSFVEAFRGWGRSLRRAIQKWYLDKPADNLAYQMIKYRQRGGWSHRDLLRLAHPKPISDAYQQLFSWAAQKGVDYAKAPALVSVFEELQDMTSADDVRRHIKAHPDLTWEMVPTEHLSSPAVWEALLPNMAMTAMLRNLGRMSSLGLFGPMSPHTKMVVDKVTNPELLKRARIHPVAVLKALVTYASGKGFKGSLSWHPVAQITDALDEAFHLSFGNVVPTNKRLMLALDVSGSMSWQAASGLQPVTPAQASAAMALTTARTESNYFIFAFADTFRSMNIGPRQRLDDVLRQTRNMTFGGTDCSLPMLFATQNHVPVDAFVVYTDNETWRGFIHPVQALRKYRDVMGIPAKLIVVGMASNGFSIADPNDAGMLDVVGFDSAVPNVMSDFIREEI